MISAASFISPILWVCRIRFVAKVCRSAWRLYSGISARLQIFFSVLAKFWIVGLTPFCVDNIKSGKTRFLSYSSIIHDSENSASLFNGIVRKLFGYFGGVKIILVFFLEPASLFLTLLSVCVILMPRRPKKGTIEDWPNASNSPPRKPVFKRNTMAGPYLYK